MNVQGLRNRLVPFAVGLGLAALPVAWAGDPHAQHKAHLARTQPMTVRSVARYDVPNRRMFDQTGTAIDLHELLDTEKPVLVNFIFTTCTAICPMMSSIFTQVQRRLGEHADDVLMISLSIDPEQDTPAVLAEYAERFGAGPQWRFLTGSLEDSIAVQQAFDAYRGDKMNHAPLTLMRGAGTGDWVRFDGFSDAEELAATARSML